MAVSLLNSMMLSFGSDSDGDGTLDIYRSITE